MAASAFAFASSATVSLTASEPSIIMILIVSTEMSDDHRRLLHDCCHDHLIHDCCWASRRVGPRLHGQCLITINRWVSKRLQPQLEEPPWQAITGNAVSWRECAQEAHNYCRSLQIHSSGSAMSKADLNWWNWQVQVAQHLCLYSHFLKQRPCSLSSSQV